MFRYFPIESPVLLSSGSFNNSEDDWESVHSLDKESFDLAALSDVSSDIEILSTSAFKEKSFTQMTSSSPLQIVLSDDETICVDACKETTESVSPSGSKKKVKTKAKTKKITACVNSLTMKKLQSISLNMSVHHLSDNENSFNIEDATDNQKEAKESMVMKAKGDVMTNGNTPKSNKTKAYNGNSQADHQMSGCVLNKGNVEICPKEQKDSSTVENRNRKEHGQRSESHQEKDNSLQQQKNSSENRCEKQKEIKLCPENGENIANMNIIDNSEPNKKSKDKKGKKKKKKSKEAITNKEIINVDSSFKREKQQKSDTIENSEKSENKVNNPPKSKTTPQSTIINAQAHITEDTTFASSPSKQSNPNSAELVNDELKIETKKASEKQKKKSEKRNRKKEKHQLMEQYLNIYFDEDIGVPVQVKNRKPGFSEIVDEQMERSISPKQSASGAKLNPKECDLSKEIRTEDGHMKTKGVSLKNQNDDLLRYKYIKRGKAVFLRKVNKSIVSKKGKKQSCIKLATANQSAQCNKDHLGTEKVTTKLPLQVITSKSDYK